MRKFSLTLALAMLLAGVVSAARAADEQALPAVGTVASDFTLPSQDGTSISLASFRGQWVVLYFYPKDMTTGCTIEAHNFQRDEDKFNAAHAVILGVSVDTADSHKQFCTKENLRFRLLADPEHKVVSAYGSLGQYGPMTIAQRNTFLISPDGHVAYVWTHVEVQHHSEEVLAKIAELKAKL